MGAGIPRFSFHPISVAGGNLKGSEDRGSRRWRWIGLSVLVALIAISSAIRIGKAFADPVFKSESSRGMLRSDPATLYYFTQRIVESNGKVPADFRADPRLEYPQ